MPKANVLRRLKIREVSSVDRGAGEGVRIMLMKRQLSEGDPNASALSAPSISHTTRRRGKKPKPMTLFQHQASARRAFPAPIPPVKDGSETEKPASTSSKEGKKPMKLAAKREFSAKERERLASSGAAMSGGGYPISTVADLHNAIRAIGRAKNPAATRAHIRSRARALGRSDLIPASWGGKAATKGLVKIARELGQVDQILKGAISFDAVLSEMESPAFSRGLVTEVKEAGHAFKCSVRSIAECDDLGPNEKSAAIRRSFGQFMDHLARIAPENIIKAFKRGAEPMPSLKKQLRKAFTSVGQSDTASRESEDKKPKDVTGGEESEDIAEAGNNNPKTATTKKLKKAIARYEAEIALWKSRTHAALTMEKAAKEFMNDPENDMDEDDKKKFLDASPEDRVKIMEANPIEKMTAKRIASLPEPVRKQLEAGNAAAVAVEKMTEENELVAFGKRAVDLGQPETFGAHLRVLAKGIGTEEDRTKAYAVVEAVLKAYVTQAKTAGLFNEFGSSLRGTGSAADQLMAKADALMVEINKTATRKMTREMAFDQVYTDPANADLIKQYKNEQRRAA